MRMSWIAAAVLTVFAVGAVPSQAADSPRRFPELTSAEEATISRLPRRASRGSLVRTAKRRFALRETCGGNWGILRRSELIEGGSREGFNEAVLLHRQWYRAQGYTDSVQLVLDELHARDVRDLDAGEQKFSAGANGVLSLHLNAPFADSRLDRTGWDGFVRAYERHAKITQTWLVCVDRSPLGV